MFLTGGCDTSPSTIIVMGATGSGKTSFINLASESKLAVGSDLKSCTEEVQASETFAVDGCPVVLTDTPGFHDTFKSDMDILDSVAQWLAALHRRGETLAGVIYLHRISDVRFTGAAVRSFNALLAMCGDQALRNVVIVTNMWGKVTPEVGDAREEELADSFFKPAIDKGALFRRHDNTAGSAHGIIQDILGKKQVTLQIQEEIVDHRKRIEETAAGRELLREIDKQVEKRLRQLRELEKMLNQTKAGDGGMQELQQEVLKLREELASLSRTPNGTIGKFRKGMKDALFFGSLAAGCLLWVKTR